MSPPSRPPRRSPPLRTRVPCTAAVRGCARRGATWCAVALALAGCGSAPDPPPAGPPPSPRLTAAPAGTVVPNGALPGQAPGAGTLDPRARTFAIDGAIAPAGVGPTHAACLPRVWCYVADTRGDAVLVFRRTPRLELVRRYHLPGGPYGLALDARRRLLFVTLPGRNKLVELPAHGRPHALRRWPTVRRPRDVAVEPASGDVYVAAPGVVQRLQPPMRRRPPR
jgi:hypothetical protein